MSNVKIAKTQLPKNSKASQKLVDYFGGLVTAKTQRDRVKFIRNDTELSGDEFRAARLTLLADAKQMAPMPVWATKELADLTPANVDTALKYAFPTLNAKAGDPIRILSA